MFESYLRDLVNEENTVSAGYLAGTLSLAGVGPYHLVNFNMNGKGSIVPESGAEWKPFALTQEEKLLVAQLYLKHKTEKHSFYQLAQEIVAGVK